MATWRFFIVGLAAVPGLLLTQTQPVNAAGGNAASAELIINATPKVVWQAVHEERKHDPEIAYSKVISQNGNENTLEQKFTGLPILGSAIAVTRHTEIPYARIDYELVNSDKFKRLEGSWTFTPINGGKATKLQLSSTLDVGLPFSSGLVKNATQKKLNKRIGNVKRIAELEQSRLAASGREDL